MHGKILNVNFANKVFHVRKVNIYPLDNVAVDGKNFDLLMFSRPHEGTVYIILESVTLTNNKTIHICIFNDNDCVLKLGRS
jgi:hypothetical protein